MVAPNNDPVLPARRSVLSVPGSSQRKLEKALSVGADEIVIDLEDSVPPAGKAEALDAVLGVLQLWSGDAALGTTVSVRVNAPRSRWCHVELAALAGAADVLHSIVVPKVESPEDVGFVERLLDGAEGAVGRTTPLHIQALIETAAGLQRVGEIANSSERLEALIIGYADLAVSLQRSARSAGLPELWLVEQQAVLTAARVDGLQAIDGPFLGTVDDESFRASGARARALGFDGKWAIHPAQIPALNDLFKPTDEEIERASAIIAALEEEGGLGAVALDCEMLDEPVRRSALLVLARANAARVR